MTNTEILDQSKEIIDLEPLFDSVGFLLRIAQIQSYEGFFEALGDFGLRPGAFTVLRVLAHNPDTQQGALARILRIKPAHMTKLVQEMVKKGLVSRTVPENDRRSVRLSLTGNGMALVERNQAEFRKYIDIERGRLTDREVEELTRLLCKLTGLKREKA